MLNTVQKRVLAILLLLMIIITMFASYSRYVDSKNYNDFVLKRNNEKKQSFEKIVQLYNNKLEVFARDYSVWDDMVKFIDTRDSVWVHDNVDMFLDEFSADSYWIFDAEFNVVHSNNRLGSAGIKNSPLSAEQLKKLFSDSSFCSFFIRTEKGYFKIKGASVHKTVDIDRKKLPLGYLLVGKDWNDNVLNDLSLISDTKIELYKEDRKESITEDNNPNFILFPLKTWNDSVAVYVKMSLENKLGDSRLYDIIHDETAFYIILAFGSLISVSILMFFWVNKPLNTLSESLKGNNPEILKNLVEDKTEFGALARLVEQSFTEREKKDILLKEIHHRVKNNLQVISSLIGLQSRNIKDAELLKSFNLTRDRVKSIALIHEKLYQTEDLARINFSGYIRSIVEHLLFSYAVNNENVKVQINSENIFLDIDTALPCGLIINELVSNSLKYAFPGNENGTIAISFTNSEGFYILKVEDNGIGIPDEKISNVQLSLGIRLIKNLALQLKGKIEIDNKNGTTVSIKFPNEPNP